VSAIGTYITRRRHFLDSGLATVASELYSGRLMSYRIRLIQDLDRFEQKSRLT
jgi:hypothetical protein